MKPSSRRSDPTRRLTDTLHGRIRAMKDASDSRSHIKLGSDIGATGDARHSFLAGQSEENSRNDSDDEKHEKKESQMGTYSQSPEFEAASISFGALVKAQVSLGNRDRSHDDDGFREAHQALRNIEASRGFNNDEAMERKAGKKDIRDFSRTSKHAPAELSSKKAVSRKREVVPTQKINHRDPRFEPLSGAVDEQKSKKNYAFLETYRNSEISELKSAICKTKDSEAREKLKRALLSMESRKKAQEMKEQQQKVLRKHRKEEKEKIERGKRPFYLKKVDQKKKALVETFEGMKGKQVDKVIERRRKKKAAKERKEMPDARRV